jgi:hypothetical protein
MLPLASTVTPALSQLEAQPVAPRAISSRTTVLDQITDLSLEI